MSIMVSTVTWYSHFRNTILRVMYTLNALNWPFKFRLLFALAIDCGVHKIWAVSNVNPVNPVYPFTPCLLACFSMVSWLYQVWYQVHHFCPFINFLGVFSLLLFSNMSFLAQYNGFSLLSLVLLTGQVSEKKITKISCMETEELCSPCNKYWDPNIVKMDNWTSKRRISSQVYRNLSITSFQCLILP